MEHHFDIEIAEKLTVNCAIIYNNIQFWTAKNKANGKHFIEDNYWTYNSVKAWNELLPYLSQKQIRTALDKLEESGLIISGVFNKAGYDRTKWYAIKGQMELPSKANGIVQKGEPIPDNKPDNKTTKKPYDVFIDYLKKNAIIKTKVTKTKDGEKLFNSIEDKKKLIIDYLNHQKEKKEFALRITPYMEDYETVYNKKEELKENQIEKDGVVYTSLSM